MRGRGCGARCSPGFLALTSANEGASGRCVEPVDFVRESRYHIHNVPILARRRFTIGAEVGSDDSSLAF